MTGQFESTPNPKVMVYDGQTPIKLGLTATSAIAEGDEVVISGNMSVAKKTAGTQRIIGYAEIGAAIGQKATIHIIAQNIFVGKLASNRTAGNLVTQDGTAVNADGTNNYKLSAQADYATGILLEGGSTGANVRIAVIPPYLIP